MNDQSKKSMLSTHELVMCALFAALLCVSAYISIPLPLPGAPKITMNNFVLLLIALLFPLKESLLITGVWFCMGLIGLPVYIGGGAGIGYLVWAYGAYTWAFLIAAAVLPLIRGREYSRLRYTACAVDGVLIIDIVGMLYLKQQMNYNWTAAFTAGFLAFLPLDLVKAVVSAQVIPALRKAVKP